MIKEQKQKLAGKNKEKELLELITEENALKLNVKNILFWTYNNTHPNLSKIHIISNCKGIIHLLNQMSQEIDDEFKGPEHLMEIPYKQKHIEKPKHLAKIYKEKKDIVNSTKEILNLLNKDFKFTENENKNILKLCSKIFDEMQANKYELGSVLEFAGLENPYEEELFKG